MGAAGEVCEMGSVVCWLGVWWKEGNQVVGKMGWEGLELLKGSVSYSG